MLAKELARNGKHSRAFDALDLGAAAMSFPYVHPKRAGNLVDIGSIKEGVRQSIDQSERDLVACRFQCVVEKNALSVRH